MLRVQEEPKEYRLIVQSNNKKILCSCEDGTVRNYVTGKKIEDYKILQIIDSRVNEVL